MFDILHLAPVKVDLPEDILRNDIGIRTFID